MQSRLGKINSFHKLARKIINFVAFQASYVDSEPNELDQNEKLKLNLEPTSFAE